VEDLASAYSFDFCHGGLLQKVVVVPDAAVAPPSRAEYQPNRPPARTPHPVRYPRPSSGCVRRGFIPASSAVAVRTARRGRSDGQRRGRAGGASGANPSSFDARNCPVSTSTAVTTAITIHI